jgi:hypothetical protein
MTLLFWVQRVTRERISQPSCHFVSLLASSWRAIILDSPAFAKKQRSAPLQEIKQSYSCTKNTQLPIYFASSRCF